MAQKAITADIRGGVALDRHLREIVKRVGGGAHVNVGFFETETYPAGKSDGAPIPVAQAAFWNEYGTTTAPERHFVRSMIEKRSPRWGVALGNALRKTDYDAHMSLSIMGEMMQGQMRKSIQEWTDPPNADSTVARKGFNKPLIETGQMLRAVDYQVLADPEGEQDGA